MKKKRIEKLKEKNQMLLKRFNEQKCKLKKVEKDTCEYEYQMQNKKNFVIELSKQFVSLHKIIDKNKNKSGLSEQSKLKLPFILIKFQPQSDVSIMQDEDLQKMELTSTTEFELMTEIHLFEGMGLTKVNLNQFLNEMHPSSQSFKELKSFASKHWKKV